MHIVYDTIQHNTYPIFVFKLSVAVNYTVDDDDKFIQ